MLYGGLSWLLVGFWAHVKYRASYRIAKIKGNCQRYTMNAFRSLVCGRITRVSWVWHVTTKQCTLYRNNAPERHKHRKRSSVFRGWHC